MVHEVLSGLLGLFKMGGALLVCISMTGCRKDTVYERPLNFEDQRNADMGKYFGKDITLFTWNTRSSSSAKIKPSSGFKQAATSLAFLGLQDVDAQKGIIETDWYVLKSAAPLRRIKARVSGLKEDLSAADVNFVVLTQEQTCEQSGWHYVQTDSKIKDKLMQKIRSGDESSTL